MDRSDLGAERPRMTPSDIASMLRSAISRRSRSAVTRLQLQRLERVLQVADRLGVGRTGDRRLPGLEPAFAGRCVLLAGHVVDGRSPRSAPRRRRAAVLVHRGGDAHVDLLALAAQQRIVGGVADQRVLERVARRGAEAAPVDEPRLHQLAQLALERVQAVRRDRGEQAQREGAADHRGELRHFLGRAEPREARAVNESRSVAGSSRHSPDSPLSSIDRVSSSTNSGTPSVLATMCCWTCGRQRLVAGQEA